MRHVLMAGVMAAVLALPAATALAQQGSSEEPSGGSAAARVTTGTTNSPTANCPAGSNQPGCEDRSRLGTSGSTWGTGDSSGSGSMGTTGTYGRNLDGPPPGKPPTVNQPDNTGKGGTGKSGDRIGPGE